MKVMRRGTAKRLNCKFYDKDYFMDDYDHYMSKLNAYQRHEKHPRPKYVGRDKKQVKKLVNQEDKS